MARLRLILFLAVTSAVWISPALSHSFYDPWCCNDRDCTPVPGRLLPNGSYLFLVKGKEYIVAEKDVRASMDSQYHACQMPHASQPRCYYAPKAGS
jgi:hypothetical protein